MEQPVSRPAGRLGLRASGNGVRIASGVLIALAIVALFWRTHPGPGQNPRDFETLYAGAWCLTKHCNPYKAEVLNDVLLAHHRVPSGAWVDNVPIYPPTTMTLIAPLSYLPFNIANAVWYTVGFVTYTFAVCWLFLSFPGTQSVALPFRVAAIVLLMLFPKAVWSLNLGNPNLLVTGILIFVVFDDKPSRQNLRLAFFGAACLLKPQLALPFIVLLVLGPYRHLLRKIAAVFAVLGLECAGTFLYASAYPETANWRIEIVDNLRQAAMPGMSMDPTVRANGGNGLLNLQYLLAYSISPISHSRAVAFVICILLGIIFLWAAWRNLRGPMATSSENYMLAAATLASLVLLPVYHRFYDAAILILALPWMLRSVSRGSHARRVMLPLILLGVLYKDWLRTIRFPMTGGTLGQILAFVHFRYESLSVLLLACTLLTIFLLQKRAAPGLKAR